MSENEKQQRNVLQCIPVSRIRYLTKRLSSNPKKPSLSPVPPNRPHDRKVKDLAKTRDIALCGIFATLYATATVAFAPISYWVIQCRIADSLIPISAIFGWPAIVGVSLGCMVANVYGSLGLIDIVFGSIANMLASLCAYLLRKRPFVACFSSTIVVTVIVGGYLWVLFNIPLEFSLIGVFLGSFVSMNLLGYVLLKLLSRIVVRDETKA